MEKEQYLSKLSSYQKLSVGLSAYLNYAMHQTNFSKMEKISLESMEPDSFYYLAKGNGRLFVYDAENEQEITILFFQAQDMLPELKSISKYVKGQLFMQFLKDSELISIPNNHTKNIHKLFHESATLIAEINAELLVKIIIVSTGLKIQDADQRLHKLLESFPTVFSQTAVKDVASYLGIHSSTLSAMRNKSKKHTR
ncbi:cyclic nucleotide-binding domain-containing protein [Pedobacter alluvionis]|uniref:CRP-like cAMP-binding protein n=1 Tax=Pedobacter alluvionis TaxID=475253 RepID=A0A497XVJ4_9SPHI|nr:Crp/Fnr family transcriptional regulator [Pedobacter alluvionis]RLJ72633.1 CRP-like cAMP-binding protein [Pedobacter alluvionis]TFB28057.1 Crp/Fnr family transcriptional regulator [Pedobacter alluvionis]